jgi:ketosteroid isomerase-like protein
VKYLTITTLFALFLVAGCSMSSGTFPPGTVATIGAEVNQFFADLSEALRSNDVERVLGFYTLPFEYVDYEGTAITIATQETLRTFILETTMTGTILEDEFRNLKVVNILSEDNVVVTVDEHWVQEYGGSTYSGTDHLRVTLVKVAGSWKIRKTELLGFE